MGILDGIVEWIAEQVMAGLDLVTTSVLGALGCDMAVFLRYFPAAETMYSVFVALAVGIILLNWVWQLFKNFGLGAGIEAEDPVKLSIRSVIFILLALFSDEIVNIVLTIGGTPYGWIMDSELPPLSFADFNSVMLVIIGVCANGAVALITLILVICWRRRNGMFCWACWSIRRRSLFRWAQARPHRIFGNRGAGCWAGRFFC